MESESTDIADIRYALPTPNRTTTDQIFGKRKTFAGLHVLEWTFLVMSMVNICVCLSMSIYRLVVVIQTESKGSQDFTLTILIIINCVFCIFYVLHGTLREKEFEIYIYIGAILFIMSYCVLEYSLNATGRTKVKLGRLIMICLLAPFNILLSVFVAREFGWLEFKIVGASEALQNMYRDASRYTSFLLFDLQVMITFVLLALYNGMDISTGEVITLSVGIPVSSLWCLLGWQSVKKEFRCGMILFFVVGLGGPAYIGYVIYKSCNNGKAFTELQVSNGVNLSCDEFYEVFAGGIRRTEIQDVLLYGAMAAAAICLIMRGIVYYEASRVFKNFGKGLRERAFEVEANERTSLLAVPRRR